MTHPTDDDTPDAASSPTEAVAAAARGSSLGSLMQGEVTGSTVLGSIGGVLGIVESVVPGIVFLVAFVFSGEVVMSAVIAGSVIALFILVRLIRRQTIMGAVGGLIATAVSVWVALRTDRSEAFYLPGLLINVAYGLAFLVSIVVRWPLVGVIAGFVTNIGTSWRADARARRIFSWLSLIWAVMFFARIAVQWPLYSAGETVVLGTTRLIMGVPLTVIVLVVTVLIARATVLKADSEPGSETESGGGASDSSQSS